MYINITGDAICAKNLKHWQGTVEILVIRDWHLPNFYLHAEKQADRFLFYYHQLVGNMNVLPSLEILYFAINSVRESRRIPSLSAYWTRYP